MLLRQGVFTMRLGLAVLILSVAISWFAAQPFGLAGAAAGSVIAIYIDLIATLRRIGLRTGVPIRRLQDWGALGLSVLFAALAAALAWGMVGSYFFSGGPLLHLAAGGALLAVAYAMMQALFGMGRGWLAAFRPPEHEY
jgi:hypothetical protein